ncbi:MAG: hypothetical protein ACI823_002438, partial [Chitinophagales bacterium]
PISGGNPNCLMPKPQAKANNIQSMSMFLARAGLSLTLLKRDNQSVYQSYVNFLVSAYTIYMTATNKR